MGYKVLGPTEELLKGYKPRRGLEGPFVFAGGRILYYDPREGRYWDPRTDFYVDHIEMDGLREDLMRMLSR